MNKYQKEKEKIRNEAIEWQAFTIENQANHGWILYWQEYFEEKGKKYGLLKEFKENGII